MITAEKCTHSAKHPYLLLVEFFPTYFQTQGCGKSDGGPSGYVFYKSIYSSAGLHKERICGR